MTEKTNKELTREVHQAVLGIPDTDDNGLVGVVKEIDFLKVEIEKLKEKKQDKI